MVDDLQEHREDSNDYQNDTTEWENRGLTARLDKSHNSYKQKSPSISRHICANTGAFLYCAFWKARLPLSF